MFYTDQGLYDKVFGAMCARLIGGFKDMGPLRHFLGITVEERPAGGFRIHQRSYIEELLQRLGFEDLAPAATPERSGTPAKLRPRVRCAE